jgi:hypothetical protein
MMKITAVRKSWFFLVLFTFSNYFANSPDSIYNVWLPSIVGGLNFSHISFSNWTKGGTNSFTWSLKGDFEIKYQNESLTFRSTLNSIYGRTKLSGNEFRTNENDIYLDKVISFHANWKVDPYISNSIQTQITTGYEYKDDKAIKVADFFDPGIITQSFGFTYDKFSDIHTRLGLALQETITRKYRKYSDDEETPFKEETYKFETGLESVTNAKFQLDHNIIAESRLRLFTRFEDIDVWDLRWDNICKAKLNSWLNVSLTFNLVFKKSESHKVQMKESWEMGVMYNVLGKIEII